MTGSKYSNFDYELSQKILSLLKGAYPARLKKVLIVTAPLWFKAPFRILQLFVREKLRERVHMVNMSQLPTHIPREVLPEELGGTSRIDHDSWLRYCLSVYQQDQGDLCPENVPADRKFLRDSIISITPNSSVVSSASSSPVGTIKKSIMVNGELFSSGGSNSTIINSSTTQVNGLMDNVLDLVEADSTTNGNKLLNYTNGFGKILEELERYEILEDSLEKDGVTLQQFIQCMKTKKKDGLISEYSMLKV